MAMLIKLKTVSGEQLAVNPNGVTALISHDGMTEIYLYGASQCFLVEGDYWTVLDKLNGESGEPKLSSGFELGYEHGKADNNDKWLEWIEELESEIEGESQVEEIFDEDSFNSMNNEANLPEVAECESYIETDIIPLHKLFAIIERKLKELGGE